MNAFESEIAKLQIKNADSRKSNRIFTVLIGLIQF